jgi:hypothetical protein
MHVVGKELGRNEPQIRIISGWIFSFVGAAFSPQNAGDMRRFQTRTRVRMRRPRERDVAIHTLSVLVMRRVNSSG